MRILLALDGSHGAQVAHELVRSLAWPAGTQIHALRVLAPVFDAIVMPGVAYDGPVGEPLDVAEPERDLASTIADLGTDTVTVSGSVVVGRAATVIVGSMVLGSVSAEVADHAPCTVLVARTPACHRAVVALDGTPVGDRILEAVEALDVLRDVPLEVVSVAPSAAPGPGVMLSGVYGTSLTWYEEGVEVARRSLEGVAAAAAERLVSAGLHATWSVPEGDPAATLIHHAETTGADLVVVGTHGRSGLTRLLLGSVARNVLLHAHASVLVLREPHDGGIGHETPHAMGAAG